MPSFESPSLGRQLVVVEDAVPVGVVGYGCVSLVTFDEDRSGRCGLLGLADGSRVRANRRVETPASICSSTTRVNGSRSAKCR
jgi:hypothetical protein